MSDAPEIPPVLEPAPAPASAPPATNQMPRYVDAVLLVGVWMALGWLFNLDGNAYLVTGVPLVVVFQLWVRKKPLVCLWVREATQFRLDLPGMLLGILLAVLPTVQLFESFATSSWWSDLAIKLWSICGIVGAFGAAFSLRHFTRETWQALGICLATAGVFGCLLMIAAAGLTHHPRPTLPHVLNGLTSFAMYVPICFVLEEVVFRGAIDAHVHQPGDTNPWGSAMFVSALWGLWHLPILGPGGWLQLAAMIVLMPCIHIPTGTFLSLGWRRSGNLAVPAIVHALVDGVRNMLLK